MKAARGHQLALFTLGLLLIATFPAAAAQCSRSGTYHLTSPGPWNMHISARVGETCEAMFGSRGRTTIVFKRLFLVTAPARGRISLREGGYYIYTAPASPGSDSFMLRVCGVQDGSEGCADLRYTVAVN